MFFKKRTHQQRMSEIKQLFKTVFQHVWSPIVTLIENHLLHWCFICFPRTEHAFTSSMLAAWHHTCFKTHHNCFQLTPAEFLTDSCLQRLDEGTHPGTSPGSENKEKRISIRGRIKDGKKEVFVSTAAGILLFSNKSTQYLINNVHFPVWEKKGPELK